MENKNAPTENSDPLDDELDDSQEDVSDQTIFDRLADKIPDKEKIDNVLNKETFLKVKSSFINKAVFATTYAMRSKAITTASRIARDALSLSEKVREGGALSIATAAIASIETIAENIEFDLPEEEEPPGIEEQFVAEHNLTSWPYDRNYFRILRTPEIRRFASKEKIKFSDQFKKYRRRPKLSPTMSPDSYNVGGYEPDFTVLNFGGQKLYFGLGYYERDNGELAYKNFYIEKGNFDIRKAFDFIWDSLGDSLYVGRTDEGFTIDKLKISSQDLIIDKLMKEKIFKEVTKCRDINRSRSYILVGPPGTGKTSFCQIVCRDFCKRILQIAPNTLYYLEGTEIVNIVKAFSPNALVLEDIDRGDSDTLLFTLEHLKAECPQVAIFATANNFSRLDKALRRPGRFDRVIWVDNPDETFREKMIRHYIDKFNLGLPDEKIAKFAEGTADFSHAYIKEMMLRTEIDEDPIESIESSIIEFTRTLELGGDDDE